MPFGSAVTIEPITARNVSVFKAARLRALQDAPYAFGSTYAKESQFTDPEWLARAQRMNGEIGAGFLAMDGAIACGIVGSFLDQNDRTVAHLISMWTAPARRRHGVGRLLVEKVIDWGRLRGVRTLVLTVTSNNESAMRFYERLGFTRTGRTEPYPNDPGVVEYEMSREIA